MDDHAVLNIDPVADRDLVHVAAQHGAEPDTAVPADGHVADNRGRIGQKGIFSDNGNESPERSDKCHIYPYFVYVSKTVR